MLTIIIISQISLHLGVLPGSGFDAKVSCRTSWRGHCIHIGPRGIQRAADLVVAAVGPEELAVSTKKQMDRP